MQRTENKLNDGRFRVEMIVEKNQPPVVGLCTKKSLVLVVEKSYILVCLVFYSIPLRIVYEELKKMGVIASSSITFLSSCKERHGKNKAC